MEIDDSCHLPHHTLKDLGNNAFADGHYLDAITYYSLAIKKQPGVSSYYSNRALCFVQTKEYSKALLDCKRSIELDKNNLKAYFFAGQAHLELGQWDEAIAQLVHAQTLALEQHRNFGDNLTSTIRLAKRKRFEALEQKRKHEEIALQVYLNQLIRKDAQHQKALIVGTTTPKSNPNDAGTSNFQLVEPATDEPMPSSVQVHSAEVNATDDIDISNLPLAIRDQLSEVDNLAEQRIKELNDLFIQVDTRRAKREVPDYLCGRISFELMLDPVITPSGITYDRKSIVAHLHKVGHFDPLTRQPLTEDQLIPNLVMKEVVHNFLEENPWAENY